MESYVDITFSRRLLQLNKTDKRHSAHSTPVNNCCSFINGIQDVISSFNGQLCSMFIQQTISAG